MPALKNYWLIKQIDGVVYECSCSKCGGSKVLLRLAAKCTLQKQCPYCGCKISTLKFLKTDDKLLDN